MKFFKNKKGITLVSLIVTIVIMLLLAIVVLNLVLGDKGLIKKVQTAKDEHIRAGEKEAIALAYAKIQIDREEAAKDPHHNYRADYSY